MRYLLGFPTMAENHGIVKPKGILQGLHLLHAKIEQISASRLIGSEWMTEATNTIEGCLSVESIRRDNPWQYCDGLQSNFTRVIATLELECRELNPCEADRAVETLIDNNRLENDAVV